MNKKIIEFANVHNLSYDKKSIYGRWNGYQVCVHFGGATSVVGTIAVFVNFGEKQGEFIDFMQAKKSSLKLLNLGVASSGFSCTYTLWTVKSALTIAENVLDTMTKKIKELGIEENLCPYCNQPLDTPTLVTSGGLSFYAHEVCFDERVEKVKEAETEEKARPNNYGYALLGAILGSLIGGAIFVILYWFGYVASLSSMVGALFASLFYTKFGGKNDKWKIVTIAVTTLIFTVAPFFLFYIIDITVLLAQEGLIGDPLTILFEILKTDKELASAFWGDFAMVLLFYVVGILFVIISMVQQQKKLSNSMKKK